MAKPQPITVPSDDCVLMVGGVAYTPHEGESVELMPVVTMEDMLIASRFETLAGNLQAADASNASELIAAVNDLFGELLPMMARYIIKWDWTDLRGVPYAQPADEPDVLRKLSNEEFSWLFGHVLGGTQEKVSDRKNGSRALPTTSSGSARTTTRAR